MNNFISYLICLIIIIVSSAFNLVLADDIPTEIPLYIVTTDINPTIDGPAEQQTNPPHPNQFSVCIDNRAINIVADNDYFTQVVIRNCYQQVVTEFNFTGQATTPLPIFGTYSIELNCLNLRLMGIFNVEAEGEVVSQIKVFDTFGQCVYSNTTNQENSIYDYCQTMQNLPHGVYIIVITTGDKTKSIKIPI